MYFAHDTELALAQTAALVNTLSDEGDELETRAGLDAFLELGSQFSGERPAAPTRSWRRSRASARPAAGVWTAADRDDAAAIVNDILAEADAQPVPDQARRLDWHLHLTRPDAPLAQRIGAEAAMGFLDLIREDELDRLKICAADDCDDVLVDLSKNRSKRFCDTGNCGNRTNVAAYRARKRAKHA